MDNFYSKIMNNPFNKGYDRFSIDRTFVITSKKSDRLIYREMSKDQQNLEDWQCFGKPCLFDSSQVYLLDSHKTPVSPETQSGQIVSIIYEICGYSNRFCSHIGDAITMSAARNVVDQLSFIPGHFEKCWQISDKHLPASAFSVLQGLFCERRPQNNLLEVFPMHAGSAMGIEFLLPQTRNRATDLQNEYAQFRRDLALLLGEQSLECLIELLFLAYIAGTRMLILSEQAPVLEGLAVFNQ